MSGWVACAPLCKARETKEREGKRGESAAADIFNRLKGKGREEIRENTIVCVRRREEGKGMVENGCVYIFSKKRRKIYKEGNMTENE